MIGFGYDCHKLAKGEKLILGGIEIDSEFGTIAHSDGDVVLHSLCDALLGATGQGDIGEHFPDSDMKYKNADSRIFVEETMKIIHKKEFVLQNVDITIVLEKPKLKKYKQKIRESVSKLCGLAVERVNIKAKTSETMGFVGRSEGIESFCICEVK
ncbi:MAG: 2-C-methyl-D-erythritol 2,4-cyclodiphosphate synthase [bacterium]